MAIITGNEAVYEATGLGLRQSFEHVVSHYVSARTGNLSSGSLIKGVFKNARQELSDALGVEDDKYMVVTSSYGKGNWANIPWVALLDRRAAKSVHDGVYCAFLFREDMTGMYLALIQGVAELASSRPNKEAANTLASIASEIRAQVQDLTSSGFQLDSKIELRGSSPSSKLYEAATIAHKFYAANAIPDDEQLLDDLEALLEVYKDYAAGERSESGADAIVVKETVTTIPTIKDLAAIHTSFSNSLLKSHLSFGARHDSITRTFVTSLATKRFVILTGLSGSGKTQLALRFGEWCGKENFLIVPVRPDWTGAEALFGYEDALLPSNNGRRAWNVPSPLAFMLKAAKNPHKPYVLILDEMNLAHVERYFADVLSGMESGAECLPNLVKSEQNGLWYCLDNHEKIPVPKNLFVIGTVNVDETTYMFSPKVLDRANTIEFRVSTGELNLNARKPKSCDPGTEELVRGFLQLSQDDEYHVTNAHVDQDTYQEHLLSVHKILHDGGFEFAHRVFFEAMRYAALYQASGSSSWQEALDKQILQKVLPRLHGSRKRLEPTLLALSNYCEESSRFPESADKIRRMMRTLKANQFASFTE